ncbi:hypothetical protein CQA49_01650 [Helicobacter sp. MIT 00-7814]|uniref:hypothetical protein n=1 Tax=unclassified Helicobacter TaxID=2593540 RepID=UPI000E1FAC3D|nr:MULTISPECIES: hypothetical protein [unclassified Helicobacter]RDU56391.1 hypothetical protein CQA37_02095 [Helicobacter sp. MIT 99-10781]RDU56474.1 hypothetical protein CQA49_01650 [Helicobacter sp. MIT 00-7814]
MVLKNPQLQKLLIKHAKEILALLVQEGISFSILCDISKTHFDPSLPEDIAKDIDELSLFVLAGYTFESIEFETHCISFEAGFGSQNFGSVVSIEYEGVVQILLQDPQLLQEVSLFVNVGNSKLYNKLETSEEEIEEGLEHSFLALASNPANFHLLKDSDE